MIIQIIGITMAGLIIALVGFMLGWALAAIWVSHKLKGLLVPVMEVIGRGDYAAAMENALFCRWLRYLKWFSRRFVKYYELNSEKSYVRINKFMLYKPETDRQGRRVAKLHIRTNPPGELPRIFGARLFIDEAVSAVDRLLREGAADCVVLASHNKMLFPRLCKTVLSPKWTELGYRVTIDGGEVYQLTWIYCECLLIYGYDWFETERGFRMLKSIKSMVQMTVERV